MSIGAAKRVYVYKWTNFHNAKSYIGSTYDLKKRGHEHRHNSKTRNFYFYNAVRKYGWSSFIFQVLEECTSENRNDRENYWIKYFQTLNPEFGYNLRLADNSECSESTKQKMSVAGRGKVRTEAQNKANRERQLGEKSWAFGKSKSEETKERMRKSNKRAMLGKHPSEETRKKQSIASKGRIKSEEHKRKISEALRGEKSPNFGKHPTEETRQKLIAARTGKKHPKEFGEAISARQMGENNPNFGKKPSAETIAKCKETKRLNKEKKEALQRLLLSTE